MESVSNHIACIRLGRIRKQEIQIQLLSIHKYFTALSTYINKVPIKFLANSATMSHIFFLVADCISNWIKSSNSVLTDV